MEIKPSCCRALISAILAQAFNDAISPYRSDEPDGARRFINPNNELFAHYCHLIDLDPEYMAEKMQANIKKKLNKGQNNTCYALDASTHIAM
jgi:hypothetical protein